jgi:hypothetical protein
VSLLLFNDLSVRVNYTAFLQPVGEITGVSENTGISTGRYTGRKTVTGAPLASNNIRYPDGSGCALSGWYPVSVKLAIRYSPTVQQLLYIDHDAMHSLIARSGLPSTEQNLGEVASRTKGDGRS